MADVTDNGNSFIVNGTPVAKSTLTAEMNQSLAKQVSAAPVVQATPAAAPPSTMDKLAESPVGQAFNAAANVGDVINSVASNPVQAATNALAPVGNYLTGNAFASNPADAQPLSWQSSTGHMLAGTGQSPNLAGPAATPVSPSVSPQMAMPTTHQDLGDIKKAAAGSIEAAKDLGNAEVKQNDALAAASKLANTDYQAKAKGLDDQEVAQEKQQQDTLTKNNNLDGALQNMKVNPNRIQENRNFGQKLLNGIFSSIGGFATGIHGR